MPQTDCERLAVVIHDAQCYDTPKCARGEAHRQYYRDRAQGVIDRLEPEIGMANVFIAVKIILDELI